MCLPSSLMVDYKCVLLSSVWVDQMGSTGYSVKTAGLLQVCYSQYSQADVLTALIFFLTRSHWKDRFLPVTDIIVVKHCWAELRAVMLFCSLLQFRTILAEMLYITCMSQLNWVSRTTTIRGYCRHFTVQWRESVAHASRHKYREALTQTNRSMYTYANTYTQKWTHFNP